MGTNETKTPKQLQKDFDDINLAAARKTFDKVKLTTYIQNRIEQIPLVGGVRDPARVKELERDLHQLGDKLSVQGQLEFATALKNALWEKYEPFNKTPQKQSKAGKKGARQPDLEMITHAKKILSDHPINKNKGIRAIQRHLNTHGLSCGKTWVSDHKKEIFP